MSVAIDTSVIIAALLEWHEHHESSLAVVDDWLGREDVVIPAPALIESYSVMTRLPAPHRLSPKDAHFILESTFGAIAPTALSGKEVWRLLTTTATEQIAGGRVYDAHIAACAIKAKASQLLTWNVLHFAPLLRDVCEAVEPNPLSRTNRQQ